MQIELEYELACKLHSALMENEKLEPMEVRHAVLNAITEAIYAHAVS
jgi:hypothetical protein